VSSGGRPLPIAIDVMGADNGILPIVRGAIAAADTGIPVVLVGDKEQILREFPGLLLPIIGTDDTFGGEEPARMVRNRKSSSVWIAAELIPSGRASGVLSCGNSGALVVSAFSTVGTILTELRPAVAAVLPARNGKEFVLVDAGASVECKASTLVGFSRLGVAYAKSRGVTDPSVGVLSNGHEMTKGTDVVRTAVEEISAILPARQVEPADVLNGAVDVVVCDGFLGNIFLKTMEALVPRATGGSAHVYAGGLLLGVDGVVVVGHADANKEEVCSAITLAYDMVVSGVIQKMSDALS
jgi:glycerol-3-phosphate acyltransferase PlsX